MPNLVGRSKIISMQPKELVNQYLEQVNIMQLATSVDNQPWVITVHYYSDKVFNLYWVSTLERRHSQAIKQNPKVAATILIHENTPEEPYVIGVSVEGTAELIGEQPDEKIGNAYVRKLKKDTNFLSDIAGGQNMYKFYCLKPSKLILFDSKNFPDDPRQEVML
jgi:uncharacterized protein YhbP (UPF0306 family)